jgi:hypothetical protein
LGVPPQIPVEGKIKNYPAFWRESMSRHDRKPSQSVPRDETSSRRSFLTRAILTLGAGVLVQPIGGVETAYGAPKKGGRKEGGKQKKKAKTIKNGAQKY